MLKANCHSRFLTSRVFRNTIIYDLSPKSRAIVDVELGIDSHSETSSSGSWQSAESSKAGSKSSKSYRFPLMELPAELRIMIAKHVLHVSDGLWWIWINYRKGPRIASVEGKPRYLRSSSVDNITAIARTCKKLYQETHGLLCAVNVVDFNISSMHGYLVPRRCEDTSDGSDPDLRAVSEALGFCYNLKQQPNFHHIRLRFYTFERLQAHWAQFLALVQIKERLQITVLIGEWSLQAFSDDQRHALRLLIEEEEPYVSEKDQMEARIREHMDMGKMISEAVAELGLTCKNWRICPTPIFKGTADGLRSCVSDADWEMIQGWEGDGI